MTVTVLSRAVSAQIGAFSLRYRLGSLLLRAAQFFAVGCFASVVGHSLTILLVGLRPAALRVHCLLGAMRMSATHA